MCKLQSRLQFHNTSCDKNSSFLQSPSCGFRLYVHFLRTHLQNMPHYQSLQIITSATRLCIISSFRGVLTGTRQEVPPCQSHLCIRCRIPEYPATNNYHRQNHCQDSNPSPRMWYHLLLLPAKFYNPYIYLLFSIH